MKNMGKIRTLFFDFCLLAFSVLLVSCGKSDGGGTASTDVNIPGGNIAGLGGETQNGGYGVKIGDRIFSLDLVLRGVHENPYLSESIQKTLNPDEEALITKAFESVVDRNVIEIIVDKLSDFRQRTGELGIAYPVRHFLDTIEAHYWLRVPSLDCLDVKDDASPIAEKVQVAYREQMWVRLCKGFSSLDDGNQAALLIHEIIYASLKTKSLTTELVGLLFSPDFRDFQQSAQNEFRYLTHELRHSSKDFPADFFFVSKLSSIAEEVSVILRDLDRQASYCFGFGSADSSSFILWKIPSSDECIIGEHFSLDFIELQSDQEGFLSERAQYPIGEVEGAGNLRSLCTGAYQGLCSFYLTPNFDINFMMPLDADPDSLQDAMRAGAKERFRLLVSCGMGINSTDSRGFTPLILALNMHSRDYLELLLSAGADPNLGKYQGDSPLVLAFRIMPEVAADLVKAGANPNTSFGNTPILSEAYLKGYRELVEQLLLSGASPDVSVRSIPLIGLAVKNQDLALVGLLIRSHADLNVDFYLENMPHHSPLTLALKSGFNDIAKLLVEGGADISRTVSQVQVPNFEPFLLAIEFSNDEVVSLFIRKGADLNREVSCQVTPLIHAIKSNRNSIVSLLLEAEARIDQETSCGVRALQVALEVKSVSLVDLLIQKGVDLNFRPRIGSVGQPMSLLLYSISRSNLDCFRRLVSAGVAVRGEDMLLFNAIRVDKSAIAKYIIEEMNPILDQLDQVERESPLTKAILKDNEDIVRLLLARGASPNFAGPLVTASLHGKEAMVDILLTAPELDIEQRRIVFIPEMVDATALFASVREDHPGTLRRLCHAGANANLHFNEETPLTFAIGRLKTELVKLLVEECGGDVNYSASKSYGPEPLSKALSIGNLAMIRYLLEKNADPNGRVYHTTPLLEAIENKSLEQVKLLLEFRADPNLSRPIRPLRRARELGHAKIIEALIEAGAQDQ